MPSNQGVAIRSTYGRLIASFQRKEPDNLHVGLVQYIDYSTESFPPLPTPETEYFLTPFIHKRRSYKHEEELRALWWDGEALNSSGPHESGDPMPPEWMAGVHPGGVDLGVDLEVLVEEVRVSPAAPAWFRGVVEAVGRRYELDFPIKQSDLAVDPVF